MIDWQVGLSTGCFYNQSIFDCLEPIRNAGFSIIEICSFHKHLDYHDAQVVYRARERMETLGLEPYSMHAPFRDEIDISSPDQASRRQSVEEVQRAADAAAHLGVKYLVIHPGPERHDIDRSERLDRMDHAANSLNQIADHCRRLKIGLVLENMLPHLFTGPVRELLWILGSMRARDVGVCLDTGHAALTGDLLGVIHHLAGHLWMVHASDNRGQHDDHLPPGQGHINWFDAIQLLARRDFRGTVILEIGNQASTKETLDGAQQARKFIRDTIRRIA